MKKAFAFVLSTSLTFSPFHVFANNVCENEQKLVETLKQQAQIAEHELNYDLGYTAILTTATLPAIGLGYVSSLLTSSKTSKLSTATFIAGLGSIGYSFYLTGIQGEKYKKMVELLKGSIAEQEKIIADKQCLDANENNPSLKEKIDAVSNSIKTLISVSQQVAMAINSPSKTIINGTKYVSIGSLVAIVSSVFLMNSKVGALNTLKIWNITSTIATLNQIGQSFTLYMRDAEARSMLQQLIVAMDNLQAEQKALLAIQNAEKTLR